MKLEQKYLWWKKKINPLKNKIDDLNLEKDKIIKNLSNLKDSEKSESENKTDVPKDYEGDLKLKVQNEVSNLKIKSEEVKKEVGQSQEIFGKTDISLGLDKLLRARRHYRF